MPATSDRTGQVTVLKANWTAGPDGDDGRFEVMIVSTDGEKPTFSPSPAALTALLSNWLAPAGVTRVDLTTPEP